MAYLKIYVLLFLAILVAACSKKIYQSNGETIYNTGRNLQGEKLLNRSASRIRIVNSCKDCHGQHGNAMHSVSLKFGYLSDPNNFVVPYDDSLFFRFIDQDLKSNGAKANIGVIWKMNEKDKRDLLEYLKSL